MPDQVNKQLDPEFTTPPGDGQYFTQHLTFHKCNVQDNKFFFKPNENYVQNSNKIFRRLNCLDNLSKIMFYGN